MTNIRSRQLRKLPVGTFVYDDGDVWEIVKPAEMLSQDEYKVFMRPVMNGKNTRTFLIDRKYRVHLIQPGRSYLAS